MRRLQDLPVKRQLMLVILLTCSAALLLACGALAAYEVIDFRRALVRDMTVLADVLAKNTRAALAFQDEGAAQETLQALQAEPYVTAAWLYTQDGRQFAAYTRAEAKAPPKLPVRPAVASYRFEEGSLALFRPVFLNEKEIGTIYVRASLHAIYDRLQLFGGMAALILLGSVLFAFILSSRLQRPISQPILALAETARVVAEHKDYSARAVRQGGGEIGLLTGAFNQMLSGIEERDSALRTANGALRMEIAERKGAERRIQAHVVRLALLSEITHAVGERQDLRSIFQVVIRSLEEQLPIDFGCMCLYDASRESLSITSIGVRSQIVGLDLALTEQAQIAIDPNGLARCVRGQLVYEPDIGKSEFPFPRRLARGDLGSLVMAPLLLENDVFGVLLAARRQPNGFSSGDCEFLRQLSEHVALAAHQAQIHESLQQAYDDLRQTQQAMLDQERLRALGQMASGIAHDINNALSPMLVYTELLLEQEPNLSANMRQYLETAQRSVNDVVHTVGRLKEFSRRREPQLTLTPVRLNHLVEQVLELTRARWSNMPLQRGVVIQSRTELAPDLPTVPGIESEIREALINLVFNAVDAMPDGGILTLRTRAGRSEPTSVPLHSVHVEVQDTGLGMDEETRRHCLEPFFTTKGERGTGLGLAMVFGIASRHDAEIEIDSALGRGTTVRLSFPEAALETPQPTTTPLYAAPLTAPLPLRVLVVDDDPLILRVLRATLEADGHVVVTANGGQEGIDVFRLTEEGGKRFDLVMTDLGMPQVDGHGVARAVKAMRPSAPVILLTGWGQRLVEEGEVPPNVDRVLNKPPRRQELRATLEEFMARSHSAGSV
jgi:signal transduction histidine kinase/ActR/RegA family two-component response regulator/HAMP domain-containing protein